MEDSGTERSTRYPTPFPALQLLGLLALWAALWAALNASPQLLRRAPLHDNVPLLRSLLPVAITIGAFALLLTRPDLSRRLRAAAPFTLLAGYAFVGLVAGLLYSEDRPIAAYWGLAYLAPILLILALWRAPGSPRPMWSLHHASALSALALTLVLVIQGIVRFDLLGSFMDGLKERLYATYPKPFLSPFLINSNGAGRFASVILLVLISRAFYVRSWLLRGAMLPFALVSILLILTTQSRSAMAGLLVAAILLVHLHKGRRAALWSLLAIPVAALVVLGPGTLMQVLLRDPGLANVSSVSGRVPLWIANLKEWSTSPLIGLGFHADRITGADHPHNAWIHALVQAGLLGFAFFTAAWFLTWRNAWRLGLRSRFQHLPRSSRLLVIEATVLLAFFTVRSITESTAAFFGVDLLLLLPAFALLHFAVQRHAGPGLPDVMQSRAEDPTGVRSYPLLGNPVSLVRMDEAVDAIGDAVQQRRKMHVCVASVNMIMQARRHAGLHEALQGAGLVVPDGFPLTLLGRIRTDESIGRVRGTDLTRAVAALAASRGYRIYLYGGKPGVPERMAERLRALHPTLEIMGTESPPFRPCTPEEHELTTRTINLARTDIVLVGTGCPRQEAWMVDRKPHLDAPVLIAVGAAFDFIAGTHREAPAWIQTAYLEWAWRLIHDPARIWRRVVIEGPAFLWLVAWESLTGAHLEQEHQPPRGSTAPAQRPGPAAEGMP